MNINKIVIKILQGSKVTVLGELTVANIFQLQIYYMEKMCQKIQKLVAVDKLIAIRVHSILKAQNSRTLKDLNLQFSSTKIINKKLYFRRHASKFRLQCDTEFLLNKQAH